MTDPGLYHRYGLVPDVAQGSDSIYVTRLGSFDPLFSLSPDEAELLAWRLRLVAGRVREEHRNGAVTTQERDEHLHLVQPEIARARPPARRPGQGWDRDRLIRAAAFAVSTLIVLLLAAYLVGRLAAA